MKKLLLSLIVPALMLSGISIGVDIPVTSMSSATGCNANESDDIYYYLTGNNLYRNPSDTFGNTVDSIIGGSTSSINIRRHGVITGCNTRGRVSNVVSANDSNGALIFMNSDNCYFNIPTSYTKVTNPTAIDAQIHYTVGYRLIYPGGGNAGSYRLYHRDYGVNAWTCYPGGNTELNLNNCPTTTVNYGNTKYHTGECINYRVFRCGDGVLNGRNKNGVTITNYTNGTFTEQCDPNDPAHTGWGNGGCSASCQPITVPNPQCNSLYNGQTQYTSYSTPWLTQIMIPPLCSVGTVTDFHYSGTPRHFTWECEVPGLLPKSCSANQQWCGDSELNGPEACDPNDPNQIGWGNGGCSTSCQPIVLTGSDGELIIQKTLVGSGEISNTGDIVRWKIRVTASGGNVTNFIITDKLPPVLGYTGYHEIHNPGLTISSPIFSGNEIKWSVSGTLLSGDYVEIQLDTYAVIMPDRDYKNVACVRPANNPNAEDCDDVEVPVGHLEIEKTLIGSGLVANTGDMVSWKIRVRAVSGNVTDFEIEDRLPSILSYHSYTVTHSGGVIISSPSFPGNNVKWTASGTLLSGDYVEIQLNTTANWVPTQDYENVACVRPANNPNAEDCDDVEVLIDGELIIQKTLVGSGEISNTGDIVRWKIRVTASGGNVTNFTITDKLPPVLGYTGYHEIHNPGLTISSPTFSGNEIKWSVSGTLLSGDYVEIQLDTYAIIMPNRDYKNVACVKYNANGEREKCDDEPIPSPKLRIKKTFTDGSKIKNVRIGDIVAYKISFGNSGNAPATITSIKDFLPKNVRYFTGEIFINGTSIHSSMTGRSGLIYTGTFVDGVDIEIYGGITLQPGDTGDIIIKGTVLSEFTGSRTNFACIYLNDNMIDCDDVIHEISSVMCESNIKDSSNDLCYGASWDVSVDCKANGGTGDKIEILCDDIVSYSGENITSLSGKCSFSSDGNHTVQCKVNGSSTPITGSNCKGVYNLKHHSCGGSTCFIAGTKVTMADGSKKNIEDVEIGEKVLGSNGTINTVIGYDRPVLGNRHLWSINGSEYFVSDEHPFMTTEGWKSFNPEMTKLEVDLDTTELNVGDILVTDDGLEKIESVDYIVADYNTPLYNFVLDGDHTYYANSYLVHNKGGYGTPTCKSATVKTNGDVTCSASSSAYFKLQCGNKTYYSYDYEDGKSKSSNYTFKDVKCSNNVKCSVGQNKNTSGPWTSNSKCTIANVPEEFEQCFNVNAGNFSIEENEIFPFFWNMHNLEVRVDQLSGDNRYTEISNTANSYNHAVDNLDDYEGKQCDDLGTVAKDSIVCTFKIYGGGQTSPLYTIKGPCLSKENPLKNRGLISAWYDKMQETYCGNSGRCYFSFDPDRPDHRELLPSAVYYIKNFGSGATVSLNGELNWELQGNSSENNKPYGEYKIVLNDVEYLQCMGDGENNAWKKVKPDDYFVPCQNNFVLTNPYTVQKTPSGNLTASTERLSKYRYLKGTAVFSELLNAVQTTAYTPNSTVDDAMNAFINKYEKLAVKVNGVSKLGGNGEIKKVPGKDIYFVNGDVTIKGGSQNIKNPFTIVQTKGNTIIEGNVQHNMMLLSKGNISFRGNCENDQIVKGIFYARGNLSRSGNRKNTDINSSIWCTKGGLHVQGVLIGNNFNNLMNASRSHLNDWFNKEDKRSSVMNGASVLIEYSPSIFTPATMPPGAEDFTTALTIYKQ